MNTVHNSYTARLPHPQASGLRGLRLETLGIVRDKTDWVDLVFARPAVSFVEQGEGSLSIGEGPALPVRGPCVTYIEPGVRYRYGATGPDGWNERFIVFSGSRVDDWVQAGWMPYAAGPLAVGIPDFLVRAHDSMMALCGESDEGSGDRLLLDCERLIFELHLSRLRPKTPVERIRRRLDRWRTDPGRAWRLEEEARSCGLSYSRFRELFREHFGQSPHQRLIDVRMEFAARRLVETREPIKAVAFAVGYGGVEAFHRAFSARFGQTPLAYRKRQGL